MTAPTAMRTDSSGTAYVFGSQHRKTIEHLEALPGRKERLVALLGFAGGLAEKPSQLFLVAYIRLGSYHCPLKRESCFRWHD